MGSVFVPHLYMGDLQTPRSDTKHGLWGDKRDTPSATGELLRRLVLDSEVYR